MNEVVDRILFSYAAKRQLDKANIAASREKIRQYIEKLAAAGTRTSSSATERPTDLTTISAGLTQDTLGKADRLEITYVRQEVPATSALQPTEPVVPTVALAPRPPVENKIISWHWQDPNAFSSATKPKPTKQTASSKMDKTVGRKGNQAADRSSLRTR